MSRYTGTSNKKRRDRDEKKQTGLQAFVAQLQGVQQKFINEWSDKFNKLGSSVDAVFKVATNEVGRLWANQQRIVESIDHIDVNVLAIAELNKRLMKQIHLQRSCIVKLCEMAEIEIPLVDDEAALAAYTEQMKESFDVVNERRKKENEERQAAMEKAQADAVAAAEAKTEAERAEKALRDTEQESLNDATSGGPGVEIPEGAQVFGGQ